jgi:hypothetical protein
MEKKTWSRGKVAREFIKFYNSVSENWIELEDIESNSFAKKIYDVYMESLEITAD